MAHKGFSEISAQEYGTLMRKISYGEDYSVFPGDDGIYTAVGGIDEYHYLNDEDKARYIYLRPAHKRGAYACKVADCWIVDIDGNVNPGTSISPVPFRIQQIGSWVSKPRKR